MKNITRRQFLELSAKITALLGLGEGLLPSVSEALQKLSAGEAPVLWLSGQACSGCSVSLLNTEAPSPSELLTEYISLLFHPTLSTATGKTGMDIIYKSIEQGGYFLVVEGSVPEGMPEACVLGERPIGEIIAKAAKSANAVIAVGTCAAFGGIPAAENNPTGSVSVPDFLMHENINKPVITIPGCPMHPDWLVGTLVHVIKFGMPALDHLKRPKMFYSKLVHDRCPRFYDYEREKFAKTFSDEGCLFKLGCLGPITYGDCNLRLWHSGTNTCINAGAPCIGCASESFSRQMNFPFYRKGEDLVSKKD